MSDISETAIVVGISWTFSSWLRFCLCTVQLTVNGKCNTYFPSNFRLYSHKVIEGKCRASQYSWFSARHSQSKRNMSNMNKQKAMTTQSYQNMCVFYRVSLSQGLLGTITETLAKSVSVWMWVWDCKCLCLSGLMHSAKSVHGGTWPYTVIKTFTTL